VSSGWLLPRYTGCGSAGWGRAGGCCGRVGRSSDRERLRVSGRRGAPSSTSRGRMLISGCGIRDAAGGYKRVRDSSDLAGVVVSEREVE
jgi:hypothetical protein